MIGYGSGYGDGYGYGYGDGDGSGNGDGYGYGYGYGYGSGDGYGYGYGDGYDKKICKIGNYDVVIMPKFGIIKIGCQIHNLCWWRVHWRAVAKKENIFISEDKANSILERIESEFRKENEYTPEAAEAIDAWPNWQ